MATLKLEGLTADRFLNLSLSQIQYGQNMTRKELRALLLDHDPIMYNGRLWDVKSKHLGAGVYRVWLKERE